MAGGLRSDQHNLKRRVTARILRDICATFLAIYTPWDLILDAFRTEGGIEVKLFEDLLDGHFLRCTPCSRGCALWVAISMRQESLIKTGSETAPFMLETKIAITCICA